MPRLRGLHSSSQWQDSSTASRPHHYHHLTGITTNSQCSQSVRAMICANPISACAHRRKRLPASSSLQCEVRAQNDYKSVTPSPTHMICWGGRDPTAATASLGSTSCSHGRHRCPPGESLRAPRIEQHSTGHYQTIRADTNELLIRPQEQTTPWTTWHLPGPWGWTLSEPSLASLTWSPWL